MRTISLVGCMLLVCIAMLSANGASAYDKTSSYRVVKLQGWRVLISKGVQSNPALQKKCCRFCPRSLRT